MGGGGWGRRGRLGGHSVDKEGMSPHRWGCSLAGLARRVKYRELFLLFLRVVIFVDQKARGMGSLGCRGLVAAQLTSGCEFIGRPPQPTRRRSPPNPIGNGWLEVALAVRNPAVRFPLCVSSCRPAGEFTISRCSIRRFSVANDVFAHVGATCSIWQITVEFFVSAASLLCHPSRRMNVLHEQRRIT